ncbi:hypothetical protein I5E68_09840 [Novosphingobium sp. YJ-S2-02]|uniref:Uncharacterized protein n=1 Tax=Novosphingobium aureum TaxID=2792964 RepID=A0A931MLN2_9SPHN|nr:hypothetical protein [Novosphingobium aureum]
MGTNDWVPQRSGDYAKDCETGRNYARELCELIGATDNPGYLGRVMKAVIEGGTYDGVEIGFCHAIAARAVHA